MLLIVSGLAALLTLGAVVSSGGDSRTDVASEARSAPAAQARFAGTNAVPPADILRPLLTTNPIARFPQFELSRVWDETILAGSQIISYYGNAQSAEMGILGSDDLDTIASRLEAQTARYDRLNGSLDAIPALHLVYAVAQPHPTSNGLYLQYAPAGDVWRYIDVATERGMLLFLDLQIGRSTVAAEIEKILPYLRYPNVHLAIDPEFAVGRSEIPGAQLGSLSASDINQAQAALQALAQAERLPPKLLIVHQFADSMLVDAESIDRYAGVDLVIDMDGFGPAAIKRASYQQYASRSYASHGGIKLFLDHDSDLLTEREVLRLEPTPSIVIYQ